MADLDITIRRKNGAGYDVLHPTTIISQVTGLQTALDAKIPLTQKGAANGVATLDSAGLIPASQLSSWIRGGIRIVGTMGQTANDTVGELVGILETIVANSSGTVQREELVGYAFVAASDFTLSLGTMPANTANGGINPGDEGDTTLPIDLEAGDILIVSNYSFASPTHSYFFAVINNTYGVATTSSPGIVTLYGGSSLQDDDNGVITLNNLAGLTGTGNDQLAVGNHNHDGLYLGISSTAAAATKLATARTIAASGDGTWSVSFDGSANVTAGLTLATVATAGTYKSVTVNAKGLVTAGTNPTTLAGYGITDAQPLDPDLTSIAGLTGTTGFLKKTAANTFALDTSTYITGNQSISVSGDASGSGTTSIALTLATVATAGTYRSVTVNAKGLVTSGTNPTTISGYGITDAYTETEVDNLLLNRPEIYYNAAGNSDGDIILDLDSDGAIS
jgi:uncharacterized membrane protein